MFNISLLINTMYIVMYAKAIQVQQERVKSLAERSFGRSSEMSQIFFLYLSPSPFSVWLHSSYLKKIS